MLSMCPCRAYVWRWRTDSLNLTDSLMLLLNWLRWVEMSRLLAALLTNDATTMLWQLPCWSVTDLIFYSTWTNYPNTRGNIWRVVETIQNFVHIFHQIYFEDYNKCYLVCFCKCIVFITVNEIWKTVPDIQSKTTILVIVLLHWIEAS